MVFELNCKSRYASSSWKNAVLASHGHPYSSAAYGECIGVICLSHDQRMQPFD